MDRSFAGQTEVGLNRVSQAFGTEGTDAFFQRSKNGGPFFGSRWKCREKTRQIGRDGRRKPNAIPQVALQRIGLFSPLGVQQHAGKDPRPYDSGGLASGRWSRQIKNLR